MSRIPELIMLMYIRKLFLLKQIILLGHPKNIMNLKDIFKLWFIIIFKELRYEVLVD